jgi:hypothetical protein
MHICIQSLEEVLIRGKTLFKNFISVSKDAEFHADYKSIEKIKKLHVRIISMQYLIERGSHRQPGERTRDQERKLQEQI